MNPKPTLQRVTLNLTLNPPVNLNEPLNPPPVPPEGTAGLGGSRSFPDGLGKSGSLGWGCSRLDGVFAIRRLRSGGNMGVVAGAEEGSFGKGGERRGRQPALGRGIPGTRTTRPYQPCWVQRTTREGREPLLRVRDFGSVASQALKKLRRPWCGEQQPFPRWHGTSFDSQRHRLAEEFSDRRALSANFIPSVFSKTQSTRNR